jgi:N-acetylneuraminic acid mutarotase
MLNARWGAVGFAIGNYGYVCGGTDGNANYNDMEVYDIYSNSWTPKASFPGTARREGAAFSIDGVGYVGFGRTGVGGEPFMTFGPMTRPAIAGLRKPPCQVQEGRNPVFSS